MTDFAANECLFPGKLPGTTYLPELERQLCEAIWKRQGEIVHAFAVVQTLDGTVNRFPVSWSASAAQSGREMIADKVASLALLYTREGALLLGFD